MKPIIQKLWMLMAMLCATIPVSAYDFEVDGFYYVVNLEKMTATLVNCEIGQVGDIIIPEKVTYKGRNFDVTAISGAFSGKARLTRIEVPHSITSLGDYAFSSCTSLTSISGMENVKEIGNMCFYNCTSLVSITLPPQLQIIGNHAFLGCSAISQFKIPDTVVDIGSSAFGNCRSLSSIVLPNSLTNLANDLFYGCESLSEFEMPQSLRAIGDNVFYNCKSIQNIIVPQSVEKIGKCVFSGCAKLKNIMIEDSSSSLEIRGSDTFSDCPIVSVYIGRNFKGNSPFLNNSSLSEVVFGNDVTKIVEDAFKGCANLQKIHIPKSVVEIGHRAFGSSGLKTVTFEDGYETLYLKYATSDWDYETPRTFIYCNIDSVFLGRTLKIGSGSQNPTYGRGSSTFFPTTLKHLTVGDYVKNIDVVLMNNQKVTSSLSHYSNLESVQFGTNLTKLPSLINNSMLTKLSTSAATPPAANPFSNSQYMDLSVDIPAGSLDVYKAAPVWGKFWSLTEKSDLLHCIEHEGILYQILAENELAVIKKDSDYSGSITIPSTISYNNTSYHVVSIGEAFRGCSNLISITLPPTVLSLDNSCFADCVKLEQIDINGKLKDIPYGAFQNCSNLSQIQIPQTVARISGCAFKGCSSLKALACHDTLVSIEESAFENCTSLFSFVLNNVSSIGQSAFKGCKQLKVVELNGNTSFIPAECFSGCVSLETLKNLHSIIRIEKNAFENCTSIDKFDLPSIVTIGSYAFKDCEAVKSLDLGVRLKNLGDGVFYNCRSIGSLIIPGNVETFGTSIFYGCSALRDLTFNDGETTLHFPVGAYDGETSVQKKEVNGKIIQFKIKYYKSTFDGLSIEKLYLGRNLSDAQRYTISGDGGVDYYLITSYDTPFNHLPNLKELVIGENVDILGPNEKFINEIEMYETPGAFRKCNSLEKVNVKNTTPPIGVEFPNSAYSKATLIVPDNTVSLYQVADGWKEFVNILDETFAGLDEVSTNERDENILVNGEGITYMGNSIENVYVYGIDGRLIHSTVVSPNQSIALSNGLYIIRIKNKSFKVKI